MSYFDKVDVSFQDGLQLGAFGDLKTAGVGQRLDAEFIYDKNEDLFDQAGNSGGSVVHNATTGDLTLAVGGITNGAFGLASSYPVPYTAGNGQEIFLTGVLNFANIPNGTTSVFLRSTISGSTTLTQFTQANWNKHTYDSADWSLAQIFGIDFQSLKVGRIRFSMDIDGLQTIVHTIENENIRNSGYWQTPNLPAYFRIQNGAVVTTMEIGYGDILNGVGYRFVIPRNAAATMKAICCTVKSRGGQNLADLPTFNRVADMGTTAKTVSTTKIPLISIRPKETFNAIPNNSLVVPNSLFFETDNPIFIEVIQDPTTLTGASFVDVNTANSVVEFDTSATAYAGGKVVYSDYLATSKNSDASFNQALGKAILWVRKSTLSGILTIVAVRTGTSNASVKAGIRFGEIR